MVRDATKYNTFANAITVRTRPPHAAAFSRMAAMSIGLMVKGSITLMFTPLDARVSAALSASYRVTPVATTSTLSEAELLTILAFPISRRYPPVMALRIHTEDEQQVVFDEGAEDQILNHFRDH